MGNDWDKLLTSSLGLGSTNTSCEICGKRIQTVAVWTKIEDSFWHGLKQDIFVVIVNEADHS